MVNSFWFLPPFGCLKIFLKSLPEAVLNHLKNKILIFGENSEYYSFDEFYSKQYRLFKNNNSNFQKQSKLNLLSMFTSRFCPVPSRSMHVCFTLIEFYAIDIKIIKILSNWEFCLRNFIYRFFDFEAQNDNSELSTGVVDKLGIIVEN